MVGESSLSSYHSIPPPRQPEFHKGLSACPPFSHLLCTSQPIELATEPHHSNKTVLPMDTSQSCLSFSTAFNTTLLCLSFHCILYQCFLSSLTSGCWGSKHTTLVLLPVPSFLGQCVNHCTNTIDLQEVFASSLYTCGCVIDLIHSFIHSFIHCIDHLNVSGNTPGTRKKMKSYSPDLCA